MIHNTKLAVLIVAAPALIGLQVTESAATPADTCEAATPEAGPLPFMDSDDTTGLADDYDLAAATSSCAGPGPFPCTGDGPDLAYRIVTGETVALKASLDPTGSDDLALYVVTDCNSLANTCKGVDDLGNEGELEEVSFTAFAGVPYLIIVDGCGGDAGPFDLTVAETVASCPATPAVGCSGVQQARLDLNETKPGKEKIKLQWKKLILSTQQSSFGDPVAGVTSVAVCIYDDSNTLVQEFVVDRAGEICAGKPCWKSLGTTGYGYKDKESSADGISKLGYKSGGFGKGKVDVKGANKMAKGQIALPTGTAAALTGNTSPRIQMITVDGFCVTATINEVIKDETDHYLAQQK